MLDPQACERRIYRLAVLLSGDPVAATRIIKAVLAARPDLQQLDSAHLDRLTVLRSREIPPAELALDAVPRPLAKHLAALAFQPREAWVLARVYRLSTRETARAMDCSHTAVSRHLELADAGLAALGHSDDLARTLADAMQRIDLPVFYRVARRRRGRERRLLLGAVFAAVMIAIVLGLLWLRKDAAGG